MEKNRRRRRRQRREKPKVPASASGSAKPPPAGRAPPSTVDDVPDHLLELILLRLDSSACLVRAASACKRWRRVVADAGFLARLRDLRRAPLVLGHYHGDDGPYQLCNGCPAFVPSPSAPSVHRRQSFSLDFVPKADGTWRIADCRDSLLLLLKKDGQARSRRFNPDVVVCQPLSRRYHAIGSLPEHLQGRRNLGVFLLKGGGCGGIGLSSFRVVVVALRAHMLDPRRGVPVAWVYSAGDDSWRIVDCEWQGKVSVPSTAYSFYFAGRANASLYWGIMGGRTALVLDEATVGVSMASLPVSAGPLYTSSFRFIGREDGALRAVELVGDDVRVFTLLRGGGEGDEWVLENLVRLPGNSWRPGNAMLVVAHESYVLVAPRDRAWVFSVDLRTLAVERVQERQSDKRLGRAYPYELPWPPTLKATFS